MFGKWRFDSPSSRGCGPTPGKPVEFRLGPAWLVLLHCGPRGTMDTVSCPLSTTPWRPDELGENEPLGRAFPPDLPPAMRTSLQWLLPPWVWTRSLRDPPKPLRTKLHPESPSGLSWFSNEEMLICNVRLHV